MIVLYHPTLELIPIFNPRKNKIAFVTAVLHILSPAGIFLSAPYGESVFACFNYLGVWCYVRSVLARPSTNSTAQRFMLAEVSYLVSAGVSFALATSMRSNGLLSGIPLAWDAIQALLNPRKLLSDTRNIIRLCATGLTGLIVLAGFALPQVVAYMEYCTGEQLRPWCQKMPPSIYSWVQSHYWGVGIFRYWTLGNIPLFVLACPVMALLLITGFIALAQPERLLAYWTSHDAPKDGQSNNPPASETKQLENIIRQLAAPQLLLAILTATSFHVQIINRISSGYPLWYILMATWLCARADQHTSARIGSSNGVNVDQRRQHTKPKGKIFPMEDLVRQNMRHIVQGMILYAVVQAGLYAAFLPPA